MGDTTRISRVIPGVACIYGESMHTLFVEAGLPDDNEVITFTAASGECLDRIEAELRKFAASNVRPSIHEIAQYLQRSGIADIMSNFWLGQPAK